MKYLFLLILISCAKEGTLVNVTNSKANFEVTKLFEYKNCEVVRFFDADKYRYFTTCVGSINYKVSCGKNCSRNETIQTEYTTDKE